MTDMLLGKDEWLAIANQVIPTLRSLKSHEFYNDKTLMYHPVRADIVRLAHGPELDPDYFGSFLAAFSQTDGWLPLDPMVAAYIEPKELICRLISNIAGGCWVADSLVQPFASEALEASIRSLVSRVDEPKLRNADG